MSTGLDDRLHAILAAAVPDRRAGAVVGVVRDGELAATAVRGRANLEHRVPITRDTVFHVASISKQFVAHAIGLLERDGRLSLDDAVVRHLDWLPFADITIAQLLHHTSGLRDQWTMVVLSSRSSAASAS